MDPRLMPIAAKALASRPPISTCEGSSDRKWSARR